MIRAYRIRIVEIRKRINDIIDAELATLDDEELRQVKENNGSKRVIMPEETKVVMDAESEEKGK
jgi:hypothetical protein